MSPPITISEINKRLAPRNIKMLGDHSITKDKAEFECINGHRWMATINSVLARNGCRKCDLISRKVNWLTDFETAIKPLNIEMVTEYKSNTTYMNFKCNTCSRIFSGRPILIKKIGCVYCNGRKLDKEKINKVITKKRITLLTESSSVSNYGTFQCDSGHKWNTIISNVLHNKSGCPKCAKYGFNPNLPAYCYVLCYDNYIKFGITNNWKRRKAEHIKSKGPFLRGYIKSEAQGDQALNWENNIKRKINCGVMDSTTVVDGWTETVNVDELINLIDHSFTEISYDGSPHKS
jgi:DNA-directed RNA polymerase subunit RPC12/RpoP